jgi:hypothetical protein
MSNLLEGLSVIFSVIAHPVGPPPPSNQPFCIFALPNESSPPVYLVALSFTEEASRVAK